MINNIQFKKIYLIILLMLTVILVDQYSKMIIIKYININESNHIIGILNFTLSFNKGISFGIFSKYKYAKILVLCITIISILILNLMIFMEKKRSIKYMLSIINASAISNMLDRLSYGKVVDFIDLHYKNLSYPIFNIADLLITTSAVAILIISCK